MVEGDVIALVERHARELGFTPEEGEEFREPPLDVLSYAHRRARLSRLPILGRALGIVAVARQPVDLPSTRQGCAMLLDRLGRAVHTRFPPWGRPGGLSLGLTAVVLTPEPIRPEDEEVLRAALERPPAGRAAPLALIRVNPGQEAMSFAAIEGPPGAFPESTALPDRLAEHFQRFVPLFRIS